MSALLPMRSSAAAVARAGDRPPKTSGATPHHAPQLGISLAVAAQPGAPLATASPADVGRVPGTSRGFIDATA